MFNKISRTFYSSEDIKKVISGLHLMAKCVSRVWPHVAEQLFSFVRDVEGTTFKELVVEQAADAGKVTLSLTRATKTVGETVTTLTLTMAPDELMIVYSLLSSIVLPLDESDHRYLFFSSDEEYRVEVDKAINLYELAGTKHSAALQCRVNAVLFNNRRNPDDKKLVDISHQPHTYFVPSPLPSDKLKLLNLTVRMEGVSHRLAGELKEDGTVKIAESHLPGDWVVEAVDLVLIGDRTSSDMSRRSDTVVVVDDKEAVQLPVGFYEGAYLKTVTLLKEKTGEKHTVNTPVNHFRRFMSRTDATATQRTPADAPDDYLAFLIYDLPFSDHVYRIIGWVVGDRMLRVSGSVMPPMATDWAPIQFEVGCVQN